VTTWRSVSRVHNGEHACIADIPQVLSIISSKNLADCKIYREQKSIAGLPEIRSYAENHFTLLYFSSSQCSVSSHIIPVFVFPKQNGRVKVGAQNHVFFSLTIISSFRGLYNVTNVFY